MKSSVKSSVKIADLPETAPTPDYPDVCLSCGREASEAVGDIYEDHQPWCAIFFTKRGW